MSSENTKQIHIVKELPVARERAFAAWTGPAHLRWFSNPNTPGDEPISVDARPGGFWRQRMLIDDKTDYVTGGVFKEVVAPKRLVFVWGAENGWPNLKDNLVAEVTFEELNSKPNATRMTFNMTLPDDWGDKDVNQCRCGWSETLARFVPAAWA
ncbi:Bet v1-like protein [Auricularia subglabra TFB-10046 SS5]|uniref:Bet v1-like protein n=1 Tax=Auricularia subglabra (strain TFB-10046 / SS5) TaxID=717982 RepID=J0D9Q3_AURST|nr:Bet v1-like protein [Auricularia subglabra TFB-10046 SS5]